MSNHIILGRKFHYFRKLKNFLNFLIPKPTSVLVIGCGRGEILGYLKPEFGVGVDASENAINKAKKYIQNINFLLVPL